MEAALGIDPRHEIAEQILADPLVQTMMRDFGGTIVPPLHAR